MTEVIQEEKPDVVFDAFAFIEAICLVRGGSCHVPDCSTAGAAAKFVVVSRLKLILNNASMRSRNSAWSL